MILLLERPKHQGKFDLRAQLVKNLPVNAGDPSSILGSGRSPGGGHGPLTPGFWPGESHAQRSLLGYSPWGCKDSDMTE